MQSLKPQMCQIDEVPTNSQTEREIATEVPIRMNKVLPPCYVVLSRLTEEEINQPYPDSYSHSEINDDVVRKTEELLDRTAEAVPHRDHDYSQDYESENFGKSRLREGSKINRHIYEQYRRKRKQFINRRNYRIDDYSDNSSEMSEYDSSSSVGKGKKRGKRGKKYEQDSEWSPFPPQKYEYGKRLRRNTRKPIIESDTSSTDSEDVLYAIYMNDSSNSSSMYTTYQNSVPSVDDIMSASSASSISKTAVESDVSEKPISEETLKNSSQTNVNCNTSSTLDNTHNSDILSEIMRDMDKCKTVTNKINAPFSSKVQKPPLNNIKGKRGRKRIFLSNDNSESTRNSVVANILKEMVNEVCFKHRQLDIKNKKNYKKCKWCHTQFPVNKDNETMCAICCDQGKDKLISSNPNKNKALKDKIHKKSPKQTNVGKLMKKNNTMSRIIRNLPKNEMQRLVHADKSTKLSNEKGYNHCKSLSTAKESESLSDSVVKSSGEKSSQMNKPNEKKNKFIQNQKKGTEKSVSSTKKQTTLAKTKNIKSTSNGEDNVEDEKISQKKNQVSLKKFNEGLFLMSFPDPDKELNIGVQGNKLCKSQTVEKAKASENSSRFNGSRATESTEKTISPLASRKTSQSVTNDEQYQTYLLPPVPTVLVANYSSNNDKSGNYRLSSIYYQNNLTQTSSVQNSVNINGISPNVASTTSGHSTVVIPNQNISPSCGLLNNSSLSITAIPLDNGVNNVQPFVNNSMPVINSFATTSLSNSVSLMPILSSVTSLSDKRKDQSTSLNNTSGIFTNSDQSQIRINHVYSENTNESNKLNTSSSEFNMNNGTSLLKNQTKISKSDKITRKRSNSSESISSNKTKMLKENSESDTDISENGAETSELNENMIVRSKTDTNVQNKSDTVSNKSDLLKNFGNSFKTVEHGSDINRRREGHNPSVQKELNKPSETGDNSSPKDAIKSAIDLLEAVSILAVMDFEKNPRQYLCMRTQMAKDDLEKLINENNPGPEHNEKIALYHHNLEVLEIALKFLNIYGSFAKVSDHLMRKQKMEQMIQIKKEMIDDEEQEDEEANQSSCRFSQKSQSNNSFNNQELSKTSGMPSATIKMENFTSCRLTEQSAAINHIEKLQSQIAAMNNAQLINNTQYDSVPTTVTVHHFAGEQYGALTPAVAAPAPITPRNDSVGGESRETPSRGSGPRTPARPESATSQPEEQSLAAQVKKEQFEASTSPSQCSYSQNTSLTQISSQIPIMQDMSLNMGGNTISNNTVPQIAVSGTVNQIFTSGQTNLLNRTTSYNNNNQNYSNVLVNIASRQVPTPGINTNHDQNGQLLVRQQLYLPNGTQISQKQTVPSLNNQYIIPSYSTNAGGSVIMNNSQTAGQNVNALLTNVSNQQFYTSNPVSQLYYPPPSSQLAYMQAPNVTVAQNQDIRILKNIFGMPEHLNEDYQIRRLKQDIDILKRLQPATENMDQMFCAVCKNVATLRCKQCAKVAYCNTTCAKTYWHQKHKMECKPLPS